VPIFKSFAGRSGEIKMQADLFGQDGQIYITVTESDGAVIAERDVGS